MPATRLPAFMFYPGDHLKDPAVASASLAAQGLWWRLLCLMSESSSRGYLMDADGDPLDHKRIARMSGCTPHTAKKLLDELEKCGVFSRTETGIIFCRRMAKDDRIRLINQENGKKGGNPQVTNSVNRLSYPPVNRNTNRKPTPSDSILQYSNSNSEFISPSPKEGGSIAEPDSAWEGVRARLTDLGTQYPSDLIAEAIAQGITSQQILEMVDYVRTENTKRQSPIGPGAIFDRIRRPYFKTWSINQGWPSDSAKGRLFNDSSNEKAIDYVKNDPELNELMSILSKPSC